MTSPNTNTIEITINNEEGSLVGPEGWGKYDPHKSCNRLADLICQAVAKEYPQHKITVMFEQNRDHVTGDDLEDNDIEWINRIIEREWGENEWYVEMESNDLYKKIIDDIIENGRLEYCAPDGAINSIELCDEIENECQKYGIDDPNPVISYAYDHLDVYSPDDTIGYYVQVEKGMFRIFEGLMENTPCVRSYETSSNGE